MTLWSCKVKKEDKVGAGPQKMVVRRMLVKFFFFFLILVSHANFKAKQLQSKFCSCDAKWPRECMTLRDPGIEPGSVPWQGTILPLNQPRYIVGYLPGNRRLYL